MLRESYIVPVFSILSQLFSMSLTLPPLPPPHDGWGEFDDSQVLPQITPDFLLVLTNALWLLKMKFSNPGQSVTVISICRTVTRVPTRVFIIRVFPSRVGNILCALWLFVLPSIFSSALFIYYVSRCLDTFLHWPWVIACNVHISVHFRVLSYILKCLTVLGRCRLSQSQRWLSRSTSPPPCSGQTQVAQLNYTDMLALHKLWERRIS